MQECNMKEHRLGVAEVNLVIRHLKLEPVESTRRSIR